jgi:hypothetical protein
MVGIIRVWVERWAARGRRATGYSDRHHLPWSHGSKTGRKIGLIGGNRRNRPPPINKPTIFNLKFDFFGKNTKNMKKTREDFKWNGAKLLSNT